MICKRKIAARYLRYLSYILFLALLFLIFEKASIFISHNNLVRKNFNDKSTTHKNIVVDTIYCLSVFVTVYLLFFNLPNKLKIYFSIIFVVMILFIFLLIIDENFIIKYILMMYKPITSDVSLIISNRKIAHSLRATQSFKLSFGIVLLLFLFIAICNLYFLFKNIKKSIILLYLINNYLNILLLSIFKVIEKISFSISKKCFNKYKAILFVLDSNSLFYKIYSTDKKILYSDGDDNYQECNLLY